MEIILTFNLFLENTWSKWKISLQNLFLHIFQKSINQMQPLIPFIFLAKVQLIIAMIFLLFLNQSVKENLLKSTKTNAFNYKLSLFFLKTKNLTNFLKKKTIKFLRRKSNDNIEIIDVHFMFLHSLFQTIVKSTKGWKLKSHHYSLSFKLIYSIHIGILKNIQTQKHSL